MQTQSTQRRISQFSEKRLSDPESPNQIPSHRSPALQRISLNDASGVLEAPIDLNLTPVDIQDKLDLELDLENEDHNLEAVSHLARHRGSIFAPPTPIDEDGPMGPWSPTTIHHPQANANNLAIFSPGSNSSKRTMHRATTWQPSFDPHSGGGGGNLLERVSEVDSRGSTPSPMPRGDNNLWTWSFHESDEGAGSGGAEFGGVAPDLVSSLFSFPALS